MVTKRIGESGVMHAGWDGKRRPSPAKQYQGLPVVEVTDGQREAARRCLARVNALDLVEALGLQGDS